MQERHPLPGSQSNPFRVPAGGQFGYISLGKGEYAVAGHIDRLAVRVRHRAVVPSAQLAPDSILATEIGMSQNTKLTTKKDDPAHSGRALRETIESVVIAIILAFLFRTFEAEAFVIPTGSMAPTLMGLHKDIECPKCGYHYQTSASQEESYHQVVVGSVCPICRYPKVLDPIREPNERSFSGDRILVSKFAYQIGEPERWDPIVFKFPGNPKQNYIKRLIGLPEETVRIYHGDIFITGPGDQEERIARKPPRKLVALLQLVDDTHYLAPDLVAAQWPSRWWTWTPPGSAEPARWSMSADGKAFTTDGKGGPSFLRYRHLVPFEADWEQISQGKLPEDIAERRGMLITDFYAYDEHYDLYDYQFAQYVPLSAEEYASRLPKSNDWQEVRDQNVVLGHHWVGDLAIEVDVEVTSNQGIVVLDLVEGGTHYTARIDVSTGVARLSIDDGATNFAADDGTQVQFPEGQTSLRGAGKYQLRLSNCDDEVRLWVNDTVIEFNGPTTYATRSDRAPRGNAEDPGDLAPAGLGTEGAAFTATRLRVLRDVYYIAAEGGNSNYDYRGPVSSAELTDIFSNPDLWATTGLFESRRSVTFELQKDQFFPLGDNSPESQDARSWGAINRRPPDAHGVAAFHAPPYVERELLIGKAVLIYWPHAWNAPVPYLPNVGRMGIIR